MAPFQYYYWGDLLDGQIFDHEHGSQWGAFADAVASGAVVSLHNDGSVSPPTPVLNIQTAVTRRTRAGTVHGADQCITLDHALRAHTIDAARTLHRDKLIGSLEVGKLADFTELTADPYAVDPTATGGQGPGERHLAVAASASIWPRSSAPSAEPNPASMRIWPSSPDTPAAEPAAGLIRQHTRTTEEKDET